MEYINHDCKSRFVILCRCWYKIISKKEKEKQCTVLFWRQDRVFHNLSMFLHIFWDKPIYVSGCEF